MGDADKILDPIRLQEVPPAHIVVGKDTRRSSYMFEYSLVAGLTASGADAYLLHVTTDWSYR